MLDMIEDPRRDYLSLANETRDALNVLINVGGPDFSLYHLAE